MFFGSKSLLTGSFALEMLITVPSEKWVDWWPVKFEKTHILAQILLLTISILLTTSNFFLVMGKLNRQKAKF